jgi:pimeloyl-ACP methyl ester carboxylesterase
MRIAAVLVVLAILLGAAYAAFDRERAELNPAVRVNLPGKFINLREGVVHYELSGPENAPLVVLVNGFSASYYLWDHNVDALTGAGFRVLRYDLYGRGFSDRPAGAYDLSRFTRQLDGLLDGLGMTAQVDLMGISLGGQIAAAYTGEHPERVRRLALLSPQMEQIDDETIFPVNLWGVGDYLFDVYIEPFVLCGAEGNFYRPVDFPEWAGKYAAQTEYKGFRRALIATLRDLHDDPLAAYRRVGQQDRPVLVLWGEKDTTVPITYAQELLADIPQAQFHAISEAGHLSNYEKPEVVNPLLVEFLK